jgi:Zn-dependent protease
MKWSWGIGRWGGIDVKIHATFLLIVAWVAFSHWLSSRTLAGTATGVAFVLSLFACVLLHEFGHALAARRYGIATRDITLLPIGGVARLERMPDQPRQELWVALAGPAVNLVIAAALLAWLVARAAMEPVGSLTLTSGSFAERLLVANVFLVLFNLLPAFPMDGGRVLRALLAMRLEYTRATQIAASIGQGMALLFGFLGLFTNPFLVFIALFVWIGAAQEASMVQVRSALGGIPARRAMVTDFRALAAADPLERAVEAVLAGSQQDFPVLAGDRVVGVLTRADLVIGLARREGAVTVGELMKREFATVEASEMLEIGLARLRECACHTLPVTAGGRLVGLLTMENVGEFLAIQAALAGEAGRAARLLASARA